MRKFKDKDGREWSLSLTLGDAHRIKKLHAVDLLDANFLQKLATDDYTAGDMLYLACEEQAKVIGLTDEQFGRSFNRDLFDLAREALMEEIIDELFHQRQREPARSLLAKIRTGQDEAVKLAMQKINSPEMDQAIQRVMLEAGKEIDAALRKVGNSSGNSLESPA